MRIHERERRRRERETGLFLLSVDNIKIRWMDGYCKWGLAFY